MEKVVQLDPFEIYMIPALFVHDKTTVKALSLNSILFFQAESAYTSIVTCNPKESFLSSQNLGKIEKKLYFPFFCRVHRSYIVNLQHVSAIVGNGLKIGTHYIPIGRNYKCILDKFIIL